MSREAMQQALEALEQWKGITNLIPGSAAYAIIVLKQALAEPEQEMTKQKPVAWTDERGFIAYQADSFPRGTTVSPLYAHPPTPRKPLTVFEIDAIAEHLDKTTIGWATHEFAAAIEKAHGIGEQHE